VITSVLTFISLSVCFCEQDYAKISQAIFMKTCRVAGENYGKNGLNFSVNPTQNGQHIYPKMPISKCRMFLNRIHHMPSAVACSRYNNLAEVCSLLVLVLDFPISVDILNVLSDVVEK